jgi:hypothetical protein
MKMTQCIVVLSLAGVLGVWAAISAAAADLPADTAAQPTVSYAAKAIEAAAKNNKYLFIYFWRDDTQYSRVMRGVLQAAMKKMSDKAESVEVQTTDPAEQAIVTRYGVSRAPMPMVLALAPNGAITKGLPTRFDESQLRQAFVSRCTAACMKALQENKLVLLCVGRPTPQVRQVSLQRGVQEFATEEPYAKNSRVVILNAGDPAEAPFLTSLQVDPQTPGPVTVLMAPPGSVVGTFVGDVSKDELIAKLKSASSCGPGCSCHH